MTPEQRAASIVTQAMGGRFPDGGAKLRDLIAAAVREAVTVERKRCAAFAAAGKLDDLPDAMEIAIRHGPNAAIAAGILMDPQENQP
jgi:hypothetical protein